MQQSPLDLEQEIETANRLAREFRRSKDLFQQRQRAATRLGPIKPLPPKPDTRPKRPAPGVMTKAEQLAEIVDAWPQLEELDRAVVLRVLRRSPSIAGRLHVSDLPMVTRGEHILHHTQVAETLKIDPRTLYDWEKKAGSAANC